MGQPKFRIVAGTDAATRERYHGLPTADDVRQEARRRLHAANYNTLRVRAMATGCEVPAALRYFALQIDFVARSLSGLRPIPEDFADDIYWPQA